MNKDDIEKEIAHLEKIEAHQYGNCQNQEKLLRDCKIELYKTKDQIAALKIKLKELENTDLIGKTVTRTYEKSFFRDYSSYTKIVTETGIIQVYNHKQMKLRGFWDSHNGKLIVLSKTGKSAWRYDANEKNKWEFV